MTLTDNSKKSDSDALWFIEPNATMTTAELLASYEADAPGLDPSDYLNALRHAEHHGVVVRV